jgi:hypothetical protein
MIIITKNTSMYYVDDDKVEKKNLMKILWHAFLDNIKK